jgi:Activator of Hsp90 ATPase homolog 1-like protein
MTEPLITVDTVIEADPSQVWMVLTQSPSAMFMGANVVSDWQEGSPINISGEFRGSQQENGNLVDIRLEPQGERTQVTLSQTPQGGERPDDAKVAEFRKNWEAMLGLLKTAAEQKALAEA